MKSWIFELICEEEPAGLLEKEEYEKLLEND